MNIIFPDQKILSANEAILWRDTLQKLQKKVVFTNGCFDILHRGHVDYLFRARAKGDALIVLMNSDQSVKKLKGETRPINPESNRAFVLAGLGCVDAVLIFNETQCHNWIEQLHPDVYVKGADYTVETLDAHEREAIFKVGARIEFITFTPDCSTTQTILKAARIIEPKISQK